MDHEKLRILLSLMSSDSDFQVAQGRAAQKAAAAHGFAIDVVFAENDAINQSQQLLKAIQAAPQMRPDVVILQPVGTGLVHVAQAAVKAGMGWVVMNRRVDYASELRRTAKLPIFCISTDHHEVGRIQGQQLNELLPQGGSVLYVQGTSSSDAAQFRTAGTRETMSGKIQLRAIHGAWTEASAVEAVDAWLRLSTSRDLALHAVAAQNDFMAMGARKAFEHGDKAKWSHLKFLGCDCLPSHGETWVRSGQLAASVKLPTLADIAIEMLAKAIKSGVQPVEMSYTKPISYPPLGRLAAARDVANV
jgi:ribose transport system substrate-binding protein